MLALMVTGALGLGAWWQGGRSRVEWPPITDQAAIRKEAATLCQGAGGWRELQPAEYPPVMTRVLHPASISVSRERVYVALVPVPGGKRFHGYSVWPATVERPDGGITREESDMPP